MMSKLKGLGIWMQVCLGFNDPVRTFTSLTSIHNTLQAADLTAFKTSAHSQQPVALLFVHRKTLESLESHHNRMTVECCDLHLLLCLQVDAGCAAQTKARV